MKILFIIKRREDYNQELHSKHGLETGLYNSARFVYNMLQNNNIDSKMAVVIDNNDIDKEINLYKPDYVIIEALWVVPTKFAVLIRLHPNVKWIIRLHSEMPFMAQEGIAMDWILEYSNFKNIIIAANAPRMLRDVEVIMKAKGTYRGDNLIYLPNYYKSEQRKKPIVRTRSLNFSCFGAIRPLKNHLIQAIAAIEFANKIHKPLNFHINADRYEGNGLPVFHNLKDLFQQLDPDRFNLVLHPWTSHSKFIDLCHSMDLGLQVSFSETFNIVAADHLSMGVPVVGSVEIPFIDKDYTADPTSVHDIYEKIFKSYLNPNLNVKINNDHLRKYIDKTENIWINYFKENT